MSAVATSPTPSELLPEAGPRRPGPSATLGERLDSVLEAVERDRAAECPACGGAMVAVANGAACGGAMVAVANGAACGGCGTHLW